MGEQQINYKQCSDCNETKSLDQFYFQDKYSKKRGWYVYYHPQCKDCSIKRSKKWAEENEEWYRLLQDKKNKNPAKSTIEKWNENAKRQRESGYAKEWQNNNKDKIKIYNEQHQDHVFSEQDWEFIKDYFGCSCAYCGLSEIEHNIFYNQQLHKEHGTP